MQRMVKNGSVVYLVVISVLFVFMDTLYGCGSSDDNKSGSSDGNDGSVKDGQVQDTQVQDTQVQDTQVLTHDEAAYHFPKGDEASVDDKEEEEEKCGGSPFEASRREVNLLLVIDKSGSMEDTAEGFSTDKWSALKAALRTVLEHAQEEISFGLELFPMPDGCKMPDTADMDVAIEAGVTGVPKILKSLEEITPDGGTPTAVALQLAFDYFLSGKGSQLQGEKALLLATDGGPNCNDSADFSCKKESCTTNLDGNCPEHVGNCCDTGATDGCLDDVRTLTQIEKLASEGISTIVVGIPGSEVYASSLDQLAEAGGASNPEAPPDYFAVSSSGTEIGGLTQVLESITKELITSCKLQLASDPPDHKKLNVEIQGERIPQPGDDGWELDEDTDPPTIVIKGKTCERIETIGVESVEVIYGCPTVILE